MWCENNNIFNHFQLTGCLPVFLQKYIFQLCEFPLEIESTIQDTIYQTSIIFGFVYLVERIMKFNPVTLFVDKDWDFLIVLKY